MGGSSPGYISPWHWTLGEILVLDISRMQVGLVSELTEICHPVLRQLKKAQQESQEHPPIYSRAGGIIITIIIVMIIG